MSRAILLFCAACDDYTLHESCPRCGGKAIPNRPARFSPEDPYGKYRRRLKAMQRAEQGPADAGGG